MLSEALMAVAAAGGTAIVQAAGTDAWADLRQRVALLLGRGDTQREGVELERLDRTAQALEEADAVGEADRTRLRQEASWQTRFESLLEGLEGSEQQQVAAALHALAVEQQELAARQGVVSNIFQGPAALQVGNHNKQENRFNISNYLPSPGGPRVVLQVSNSIPVYDLPDGSQDLGGHFVSVEAVNIGDQPIAITSWGIELPGDRRMFVTRSENWATPLPHVLSPGAPPARFLVRADELRRVEREQRIPYTQMRPYVGLADGTVVQADRSVPLA
ncbi:hypothetical protein OG239_41825 (plasmid) [Streptomyces sp. NBC_00868]|uniref:hypothetical protein n=1 Tax=Streptomyces sp. NBC_00868 TaxID=2903683 RepID=UPI002F910439|nr:hypothetical protein OG239_41825 [Streptomyces sp. NBC_00868]